MLEDWLEPGMEQEFKQSFKGVVYESRCSCGSVMPILFEEGTDEHGMLLTVPDITLEVMCWSCGEIRTLDLGKEHPIYSQKTNNE